MADTVTLLRPGDPEIVWLQLPAGIDEKNVIMVDAGRRSLVGTTRERITHGRSHGTPVIERQQTIASALLGDAEARVAVDALTYRPLRVRFARDNEVSEAVYHEHEVVGTSRSVARGDERFTIPFEGPIFDAYAIELLIRVLPFTPGYKTRATNFRLPRREVMTATLEVATRPRAIPAVPEEEAWEIRLSSGAYPTRYWVGADSRRLLQQASMISADKEVWFTYADA